jgi:hypothetical protein
MALIDIYYINTMYKFTDKYICLVLTCNKSPYKEKLISNLELYKQIGIAGFKVCFLYADPKLNEIELQTNIYGYYSLTVPTEEEYTNLATKMHLAYCFFNNFSIKGILKIDDDVWSVDDSILDLDYYKCDYLGIYRIPFSFLNTDNHIRYRKNEFKDKCVDYTNEDICINTIFYPGHFYWISKKALNYISHSKYDSNIFGASEDAFVGLTLANKEDIKYIVHYWKDTDNIKILE